MALPLAEVVISVFQGLALLLTLFRIYFRVSIGRFWWEDAWASLAFVCGLVSLIAMYTHDSNDQGVVFASGWIYMYTWPGIIWSVRLSLVASIARVVHPGRLRRLILASGWFFVTLYLALAAQKTHLCVTILHQFYQNGSEGVYMCLPNRAVAISEVTADVVADTIVIIIPLRVLWSVRLQTKQRRMIMAIFSSSAAVTVTSILHSAAEIAAPTATWQGVATLVEITVSLVVCNLLVMITLLYRRVVKEHTYIPAEVPPFATVVDSDDDFSQSVMSPETTDSGFWTRILTTIDLTFGTGRWTVTTHEKQ